jgi:hypothetical protein
VRPEWEAGVPAGRSVVEVKGAGHNIKALVASEQVAKRYLPAHGLVLATNLWQFRPVGTGGRRAWIRRA